jgi:predicted nucleic acid binding AN1-type Zn finger protein
MPYKIDKETGVTWFMNDGTDIMCETPNCENPAADSCDACGGHFCSDHLKDGQCLDCSTYKESDK